MAKTIIRVDDRLIHGQISVAWAQTLSAKEIIAIDDPTASNKMLQTIMLAGVSKAYNPKIITFNEAYDYSKKEIDGNRLVIVRSCENLEKLVDTVTNLSRIYLGNIQKTPHSKYNLSSGGGAVLYFADSDVLIIDRLVSRGIDVVLQMVPSSGLRTWEQAKKQINK